MHRCVFRPHLKTSREGAVFKSNPTQSVLQQSYLDVTEAGSPWPGPHNPSTATTGTQTKVGQRLFWPPLLQGNPIAIANPDGSPSYELAPSGEHKPFQFRVIIQHRNLQTFWQEGHTVFLTLQSWPDPHGSCPQACASGKQQAFVPILWANMLGDSDLCRQLFLWVANSCPLKPDTSI